MPGVDPLAPGALLAGRYRIESLLGTGGMSFVHRGTDEALGREVAIKALVGAGADASEAERIRSEIDLLATLGHRSLVTLFDAGSAVVDGVPLTYLVMELMDGPTLAARRAEGPIAPVDVAWMTRDLAEALVVVHANGVVHRDIKPANILLAPSPLPDREFDAKLADFGIASIVDAARLTATGTVLGTAAYLSPEQATGARVGPASDIYSLGLVLLEAVTGEREYPGPLIESLTARHFRDPEVPGWVGYRWKSLLVAMTARDPDSRPTASQVLDALADGPGSIALPAATSADDATSGGSAASGGAVDATATADLSPANAATAVLPGVAGAAAAEPVRDDGEPTAATVVLGAGSVAAGAGGAAAASGAAHAGGAASAGGAAPAGSATAAAPTARRRRRWTLAGAIAAGCALLAVIAAVALQGAVAPEAVETPRVAETPTSSEPAPTPVETTTAPAAPAPAPPAELPAGTGDDGSGNEGNGNEGNGNEGNGNEGGGPGSGNEGGGPGSGNEGGGPGSGNEGGGSGGGNGGSGGGGNQGGGQGNG